MSSPKSSEPIIVHVYELDSETNKFLIERERTCFFCSITFTTKKHLNRHTLICKKNPAPVFSKPFSCVCGVSFSRKDGLVRHVKTCDSSVKKKNILCLYSKCSTAFRFKDDLIEHLKSTHNSKIDNVQILHFIDESNFLCWKEREEARTFSYFSKISGHKSSKYSLKNYYYCQHSGSDRPHKKKGEPDRLTNRKRKIGRIKTNSTCIAKMTTSTSLDDGHVEVLYYPTHNHPLRENDVLFHPLSTSLNNLIEAQIALNVPATDIVDSLQTSVSQSGTTCHNISEDLRKLLLSKKRITQRVLRVKRESKLHDNDFISVSLKVENLSKESYNPVVIFKETGSNVVMVNDETYSADEALLMLGIQTQTQRKLMLEGCKKILVMGDTQCLTQYENLKLFTLMIVDDSNKAWCVGHLISNDMTGDSIDVFMRAIKYRMLAHQEELIINCVITDDNPAFINGLESAMLTEPTHILCQWHLMNVMRANIREKCPPLFSDAVYDEVKNMISTKSIPKFEKLANDLRVKYAGKADDFIDFLDINFFTRCHKWAMCCRQGMNHGNVNTIAHVESFHNNLKKVHFKKIPVKRLDYLVDVLLKIAQNEDIVRERGYHVDRNLIPATVVDVRHSKGMDIPDVLIEQLGASLWEYESPTQKLKYHITQLEERCTRDVVCCLTCRKPPCIDLCTHLYVCSCPESNLLCEHIHKIHSIIQPAPPSPLLDDFEEENMEDDNVEAQFFNVTEEIVSSLVISDTSQTILNNLAQLTQLVKEGNITDLSSLSVDIRAITNKYTSLSAETQTTDASRRKQDSHSFI